MIVFSVPARHTRCTERLHFRVARVAQVTFERQSPSDRKPDGSGKDRQPVIQIAVRRVRIPDGEPDLDWRLRRLRERRTSSHEQQH
jgi:hypothetical protein